MPIKLIEKIVTRSEIRRGHCWEWTGGTNGVGYGVMVAGGRREYVHRVAYRQTFGEIPPGLVIDHLCRNTLCFNPEHLEAVTTRENVIRGLKGQQTACIHGHPFDSGNTYIIESTGHRSCRACRRRRERERRVRLKSRGS